MNVGGRQKTHFSVWVLNLPWGRFPGLPGTEGMGAPCGFEPVAPALALADLGAGAPPQGGGGCEASSPRRVALLCWVAFWRRIGQLAGGKTWGLGWWYVCALGSGCPHQNSLAAEFQAWVSNPP